MKIGKPGGTLEGEEMQRTFDRTAAPGRLSLAAGLTVIITRPLRVPDGWWLVGGVGAKPRLVLDNDSNDVGCVVADGALTMEHLIVQGDLQLTRESSDDKRSVDKPLRRHGVTSRRGRLALHGVDVRAFAGDGVRVADRGVLDARHCNFSGCGLRGVRVAGGSALLEDCTAEGNRHGVLVHLATAVLRRVSTTRNRRHGIVATHCPDGVHMLRCFSSENGRSGIVLGGSPASEKINRDWSVEECVSVRNGQLGFAVDPTVRGEATALLQRGRIVRSAAIANGVHGFNVTHADDVVLDTSVAIGNTRDGFAIANSIRVEVRDCDAFRNGVRGVAFYGEADRIATNRLRGGDLRLNEKSLHVSRGLLATSSPARMGR